MEYKELQVLFQDVTDKLIKNKSTSFHPLIEEFTKFLTKDLNISIDELDELCPFIEDLFLEFTLEGFNQHIDIFIDHCKYKMKSSDLPSIKKIFKQLEIREKIEQINSDFV